MRLELPHVEDMGLQRTEKLCITGGGTAGWRSWPRTGMSSPSNLAPRR